jgi:actinin alpha
LNRFRSRAAKIREWQEGKHSGYLAEDLSSLNSQSVVQAKIQIHSTFDEELVAVNENVANLKPLVHEIVNSGHEATEEVSQTLEQLQAGQTEVSQKAQLKLENLKAILARIQDAIGHCIEFARKSEQLNLFFEDADLALTEPVAANSVEDITNYDSVVENLSQQVQAHQETLRSLANLDLVIRESGRTPDQFTSQTYAGLADRFQKTVDGIETRKLALYQERVQQEQNNTLLQEFATNSSAYVAWGSEQQHKLSEERNGTLQEQLDHLRQQSQEVLRENQERLQNLQNTIVQLDEAHVLEKSSVTQQDLTLVSDNLEKTISKISEHLEQEILAEKGENISAEQLKEFKETFNHFDKDKNNLLNKLEFKAATASLGEDMDDQEIAQVYAQLDTDGDSQLTFDEFIDFVTKRKKDSGGYDAVLAAFKSIAGEKNYVTEVELRSAMEKDEAEYLLANLPQVEGGYDFEAYVRQSYGK